MRGELFALTATDKITSVFEEHIDKGIIEKMLFREEKMSELPMNSLDFIKIIVKLEDEFSIEVDNDRLSMDAFYSLSDFFQYIENLVKEADK